jgi:hypothetical protein
MNSAPGIDLPSVRPDTVLLAGGLLAAVGVGVLAGVSPVLGVAAMGGLAALWLLSYGTRMVPVFHVGLVAILIGYAFLGKGMAYVGVAPLFVGELVLGLGVLAILVSLPRARWHPVHLAIALFAAWGLVRTIPYLGVHGIDALRDGVAYGYAVFAVAVSLTVRRHHVEALLGLYRRWIPVFIAWVPVAAIVAVAYATSLPVVPGSDVPVVVFKGGDTGVHLGAIGAFMLLGLGGTGRHAIPDALVWAGWLVAVGVAGAVNRGGMVAASMMAVAVVFGRTTARWGTLAIVGLFLVAVIGLVDPQVDVGISRRLSVDQVIDNALSVFGGGPKDPYLEGTKEWRLRWWNQIVDYTINGEFLWTGKGFGINLADADGFQVAADGSLRAPHNGHLELLARGGLPMLLLWLGLQVVYGVTLLRAALRARAAGMTLWVGIVGWITVYWLAGLVNASFDPYLQGPMGGIWFFSMMGLGVAVARIIQDEATARAPADERPRDPVSEGAVASGRSPG